MTYPANIWTKTRHRRPPTPSVTVETTGASPVVLASQRHRHDAFLRAKEAIGFAGRNEFRTVERRNRFARPSAIHDFIERYRMDSDVERSLPFSSIEELRCCYAVASTTAMASSAGAKLWFISTSSTGNASRLESRIRFFAKGDRPHCRMRNLLPRFASFESMRGSHGQLLRTIVLVCLTASSAVTQTTPYPKPQTPSAVGQLAPDFRLKNQGGKVFHLAALRGHWVLLFFYRGYW